MRAVVDSLEKVLEALTIAGVEMIPDGAPSAGAGREVRLIARRQKIPPVGDVGLCVRGQKSSACGALGAG